MAIFGAGYFIQKQKALNQLTEKRAGRACALQAKMLQNALIWRLHLLLFYDMQKSFQKRTNTAFILTISS